MTSLKFTTKLGARGLRARAIWVTTLLALFVSGMLLTLVSGATAAVTAVDLGTATSFAVLAGTPGITDVSPSAITGDVGLDPASGAAIGVPCAEVTGTVYSVDTTGPSCQTTDAALLTTAKTDLTTAYTNAANETPSTTLAGGDNQLGGQNLGPGIYNFPDATTANLTGNLILTGSATDVWVFQAANKLVTASSSSITFAGGAQACNVFWEVGSSATLGTNSTFAGTIMALTDIIVPSGVTITGRVLARNGQITLDHDTIKRSDCATTPTTSTTTSTTTTDDSTTTDATPPPTTTAATTTAATTTVVAVATLPTRTVATPTDKAVTSTTAGATPVAVKAVAVKTATVRAVAAARATATKAAKATAVTARAAATTLALHRAVVARAVRAAAKRAAASHAAAARGHAKAAVHDAGFTG